MNIFVLDTDPKLAAKYHNNKHVVKMILETTQILSAVMNVNGMNGPYKNTHINHPCVKWAGESTGNFVWTKRLLYYLLVEYTERYNKVHKCASLFMTLIPPSNLLEGMTDYVQCMPDQYKVIDDPVQAYRNYYLGAKRDLAFWKNEIPEWWK